VARKTRLFTNPDEPFGGVVLVPFNGITIVHGELMMEVVITFTNICKSSDDMVTRDVLVIKWSLSKPVSKRVDTECRLERNF
jgi:hypothetical protein